MDIFIARQPIFDVNQKVYGYELLFRSGQANYCDALDGDSASMNVITNSLVLIGIDKLTGGRKAFINLTRSLIIRMSDLNLPREYYVMEVLEDVEPDEEIVEAVQNLKKLGYDVALDDFVFDERFTPLLDLADIIKIDFMQTPPEERKALIDKWGGPDLKFLAEKVETRDEFELALDMGYSYFQGYFFEKPAVISKKAVPGFKINSLRLLGELYKSDVDLEELEKIIKPDVSLTYKLLRLINSAAFGISKEIKSVKHALIMLGMKAVRNWVSLITLADMGQDKPEELLVQTIVRARFLELMAPVIGLDQRAPDCFLMGMFSTLDAVLDVTIEDALADLPLAEDVKSAIIGGDGQLGSLFTAATAYEKADFQAFADYAGGKSLPLAAAPDLYFEAVDWANQIYQNVSKAE